MILCVHESSCNGSEERGGLSCFIIDGENSQVHGALALASSDARLEELVVAWGQWLFGVHGYSCLEA